MSKIQPALFGLQAMEKQIPQLLPQIMQYPFFGISDKEDSPSGWSRNSGGDDCLSFQFDDHLAEGHVRLGLLIDDAIYALLRSHSAKGAKQAEAIISTANNYNYNPVHSRVVKPHIPPVICHSSLTHKRSGHHRPERHVNGDASAAATHQLRHNGLSVQDDLNMLKNQPSNSSISERSERSTSGVSLFSSPSTNSVSSLPNIEEDRVDTQSTTPTETSSPKSAPKRSKRKDSLAHLHHLPSSESELSLDDYMLPQQNERKLTSEHRQWNTSTVDNSLIVSQYGDSTYPLLMWDQRLKLDFRLSSSMGLITGIVTGIDPEKSTVTMKVANTTGRKVGIAIRAHRQTTVYQPCVIFPSKGLYTLGSEESERIWEDNVEFYPRDTGKNESFVIDLFVCTLDGNPSWNIQRKYAIMKAQKSPSMPPKKMSKRRPSHFHMPGTMEQKGENLKLIISHGLQCVVKRKFDEAEIILSQALHLPDFERVPLKAFLYICLAVVADKRKKLGHSPTLRPVLMANNAADHLVNVVESSPGAVKMPKMLMLVKQLKKELNIKKTMKEEHKKVEKQSSLGRLEEKDETSNIDTEGGKLIHKFTELTIPPDALLTSTNVTLSPADCQQLRSLLKSQGWERVVHLASAMHVQCVPSIERFQKPVEITTVVSEGLPLTSCSIVRLLQSKYLRHWQDITDDVRSKVVVMGDKVTIQTDQTGWLAVAIVQFDVSLVAQLAMRSLSAEPTTLQFSTYGLMDTESNSMQVAIFVTPCSPSEDSLKKADNRPQHHRPIAFPHTIQAYPGEKLQLQLQGGFEPDEQMGEKNLNLEFEVQSNFQRILEKWLRITESAGGRNVDNRTQLHGKLIINSCRNLNQNWEPISEIHLSTKGGYEKVNSSTSGSELSSH